MLDRIASARSRRARAAPQSTGRRLALARWLSREDNPLSTRVIVNRIWQYHFGRGLAGTPSDFGRLGDPPSHPELLDWLAKEFVRQGWRLKPMHRLILTSAAYRQSASRQPARARHGHCGWIPKTGCSGSKRSVGLRAEEIRDAMLSSSGELGTSIGGPSVLGSQPRRTIDTRVIRNSPDELLDAFDSPGGNATTPRRNTTTTAPQALLLFNGEWVLARAEAFAKRLEQFEPCLDGHMERVTMAYRLAFGRRPLHRRNCGGCPVSGPAGTFDGSGTPSAGRCG